MKKQNDINDQLIISKIYQIRGQKVMLDEDLAEMYGVETKRINEQVKRNSERFPNDFMFQINQNEYQNLKSQFATSNWGGRRKAPYVFTEYGVLMLSSVLNSPIAIEVNIKIMRIYAKLRTEFMNQKDILIKLIKLEKQILKSDLRIEINEKDIVEIFNVINLLIAKDEKIPNLRKRIGFSIPIKKN